MMFTTCFWTLLSQKDLSFVYLSPWLSKSLGSEHDLLLGTSFFDYFHPEEQELARHDLSELVKKKSLTYSVTRCQYNTIQAIRKKLQQSIVSTSKSSSQQMPSQYSPVSSTMTSPNFTSTVVPQEIQPSNDDYIVMDVGMNVVSQEFVLACFHSDDVKQSNSNCVSSKCGEMELTKEEVNKLTSLMRKHGFSKVQTPPSTPFPEIIVDNETPNRIFQILDKKSRNLIFSWPDTNNHILNVSYNKNDFSRLVKNVILDSNNINRNNNLVKGTDDVSPNCLRLISDKHYILTSGTYRQVESVIIPYGDIIFACFQILPSNILGVSSAFSKPKARSAPCSPATINNNNGIVKRPRSPGSLSPLPSPYYDDEIRRYVQNHHSNSSHYPQEVPDFILDKRSSKRHRIDPPSVSSANDSLVPVKITYSPPNPPQLLLNPISPRVSPSYHDQQQRCQFPFPPQIIKDQSSQSSLQPPQQPYYPFVVPPPGPQSRQPSPKQQDYPSPKNHPSQFLNQNNNHHMVQPQQQPASSQSSSSVAVTQFTSQQRRNNNGNSGNNNNSSSSGNNNNSNNNVQGAKKCESCHTSTSPEWRRGPTGHKTLCNACGLRYSRTIARENRKREQAQREQEQRQREQREREERARERAAATAMMNRVIEPPFSQYVRPSNAIMPPGQQQQQQQQQQHHHHQISSAHPPHSSGPPQQYHPSTLPPLNYHRHQPSLPQPHHHHHHHHHNAHHNVHHNAHPIPPPLNDRVGYTLPPPNFFDRQQNGAVGASNNSYQIGNPIIGVVADNHRRDQPQHNGEGERYTTNMMNNMPPTANAYPKEAYFGRAQ